jgi:isopentenyl-diphosphate delta-isomerase
LGYYDGEMDLNPDEVVDYKWIWIEKLKKDIEKNAESYTQRFKIILEKYFSLN